MLKKKLKVKKLNCINQLVLLNSLVIYQITSTINTSIFSALLIHSYHRHRRQLFMATTDNN